MREKILITDDYLGKNPVPSKITKIPDMNDENAEYCSFDDSIYVKYDHTTHLYYKYDAKTDEWMEDTSEVLNWLGSAEHEYKKLNK